MQGRTLQSLSLSHIAGMAQDSANLVTLTKVLPVALDVSLSSGHSNVRPLCFYPRRSALQSLSFTLGTDANAILRSVAVCLPGLRVLRLDLNEGSGGFLTWPPMLHVERLSLSYLDASYLRGSDGIVPPDQLLFSLCESPSMCQYLRSLVFAADMPEALLDTNIFALRRLRRLSDSIWWIGIGDDVRLRQSQAAIRSAIYGRLRIHW